MSAKIIRSYKTISIFWLFIVEADEACGKITLLNSMAWNFNLEWMQLHKIINGNCTDAYFTLYKVFFHGNNTYMYQFKTLE